MSKADSGIVDRALAREYLGRLNSDPRFFIRELWTDRRLDRVAPLSDVELDMVMFGFTGPRLRGILGARGIGKTTLITAPLTVYRGFRDANRQILIPSKSATAAKEIIGLCRDWIDNVWFLQHLAPGRDQSDTTTFFDFGPRDAGQSKQPSVKAIGIDGQLESNRAHTIIPDDVETKGNTRTQEAREGLQHFCAEFKNILYPDRAHEDGGPLDPTEICYVGTYKHEESFYKDRAKKGYTFRSYPVASPEKTDHILCLSPVIQQKLDAGKLAYTADGQYHLNPIFPLRFSSDDIAEKMAEGRHEFAMEHLLLSNLTDEHRYPLRLSDLIVLDVPRDQAPLTVTWGRRDHDGDTSLPIQSFGLGGDRLYRPIAIDKQVAPYAATKAVVDQAGVGGDKTGLAIGSLLNGMYWIKYCRGLPGGAAQHQLAEIATLLRLHGAREVHVETNIDIHDTYAPLLEVEVRKLQLQPGQDPVYPNGWSCSVHTFRVHGQKEVRICDTLAPVLGAHRAVVDPAVVTPATDEKEHETLQYQLSRIQRVRKCLREDGAIDALASLIARFQESSAGVRTDPVKQRQSRVDRILKDHVRRQLAASGSPQPPPRFFEHH